MPLIDDYSNDEETSGTPSGRRTGGGATLSQATPQRESEFTPWSRFVSANQDVSKREADKLNSQVSGEVEGAKKGAADASGAFSKNVVSNYDFKPFGATSTSSNAPRVSAFGGDSAIGGAGMKAQPTGYNPAAWSSFGVGQKPGMPVIEKAPASAPSKPVISPRAVQNGPTGSKDLESAMGADAWGKLLGQTAKAQADSAALGSETGTQALIQQQAGTPLAQNGAFDAALTYGQGQKAFGDTAKAGSTLGADLAGANQTAQGQWQQLLGDIDAAKGAQAAPVATPDATQGADPKKADELLNWLKEKFPVASEFETQDGFLKWFEDNRFGGTQSATSNITAWMDQIYGKHDNATLDQFYADLRKMTPAEYEAFKYGVVPPWMGKGKDASVANGGQFGGLGNTGNRVTGTTTNTPTAENAEDWNNKQQALQTYYSILEAIAAAAAGA